MDSTISRPLPQLPAEPILFLLNDFIALLTTLPDPSGRRGRRYALAPLLALALLAKFAQHSQLRAIAEWARLRQVELTTLLGLPRPTLPHPTTWTRRLAQVDPLALDALIGAFFAARLPCGPQRPGDIQLCIDGKTLRGTIPAGACQGVHLVAAYLPGTGCVLAQLEVQRKTNEIRVAPALLALLDLHGMVVTGDALLAQRPLSAQIVAAGGEYLWTVKSNQGELGQDIAWLFEPLRPGERAADWGWRSARVVSKGHGRIEEREIVVSSKLKGYSTWPGLEQVYKLTWRRTTARGKVTEAVRYGVTSLSAREASPQRLLALTRGHWGIEGGLHGRRDVTLGEDRSQVRLGAAAHVLASLNNVVIGIVAQGGGTNLAAARRAFEYHFHKLLFTPPLRHMLHADRLCNSHDDSPQNRHMNASCRIMGANMRRDRQPITLPHRRAHGTLPASGPGLRRHPRQGRRDRTTNRTGIARGQKRRHPASTGDRARDRGPARRVPANRPVRSGGRRKRRLALLSRGG